MRKLPYNRGGTHAARPTFNAKVTDVGRALIVNLGLADPLLIYPCGTRLDACHVESPAPQLGLPGLEIGAWG